jgi:hypothetical protein
MYTQFSFSFSVYTFGCLDYTAFHVFIVTLFLLYVDWVGFYAPGSASLTVFVCGIFWCCIVRACVALGLLVVVHCFLRLALAASLASVLAIYLFRISSADSFYYVLGPPVVLYV